MISMTPIWSIWKELPVLACLFLLLLCVVAGYTLFSATTMLQRLRSVDAASLKQFQSRCANIRQAILATSYLFGLIFFLVLPLAAKIVDESRTPLGILILNNVLTYCAFAANVFAVLIVLHFVQWVTAAGVDFAAARVNAETRQRSALN